MSHQPVMLAEAMAALAPGPSKRIVDCTFGFGGYSQAILQSGANLLALDRDPAVLTRAQELSRSYPQTFAFAQTAFSGLEDAIRENGWSQADGIVLDIGVSSMQFDQAVRGFSIRHDGPLDMRMAQSGVSATDVVNQMPETDLAMIFRVLGEEKQSRRVARAIVRQRADNPITTTGQLAGLVEQVLLASRKRIHPATKIFQALRIYVNDELGELAKLLLAAERVLAPAGRLVVVAFHSLEDRLIKNFLRSASEAPSRGSRFLPDQEQPFAASFIQQQRKAVLPAKQEIDENPRARSAKMRWAIRTRHDPLGQLPERDIMERLPVLGELA